MQKYFLYECSYIKDTGVCKIIRASHLPFGKFCVSIKGQQLVTVRLLSTVLVREEKDLRAAMRFEVSRRNVMGSYFWERQKWVIPKK